MGGSKKSYKNHTQKIFCRKDLTNQKVYKNTDKQLADQS